jgi:hypothetical protein
MDRSKTMGLPTDGEREMPPEDFIVSQEKAGFPAIDDRVVTCPGCKAKGWNTGWGYWAFLCRAEIMPDGDSAEPCGATQAGNSNK